MNLKNIDSGGRPPSARAIRAHAARRAKETVEVLYEIAMSSNVSDEVRIRAAELILLMAANTITKQESA